MNSRPKLLFYCQHALGIGHLVRALALARGLAAQFEVIFLNGGLMPPGLSISKKEVEIINLPPLGFDPEMRLSSRDPRYSVEQAQELRRQLIICAFEALRPQAILIELFPFGRKQFTGELLPLLERARASNPRTAIACSLRDILVSRGQSHDELAAARANQYFDAVLVHADPRFARLEESFHPSTPLRIPVFYTGFVSGNQDYESPPPSPREPRIVVSAGGGIVGEPLLRNAVLAYDTIREHRPVEMKVIAGPFLPEESWKALQQISYGKPGLSLHRSVPDLPSELRRAAASVSQCGYNTALEVLNSRVPALVVPYATEEEDEQMNRARRLERLGAIHVLDPAQLTPQRLGSAILSLFEFQPRALDLDMNGPANSTRILRQLTNASTSSGPPDWLGPVCQALDALDRPVDLFFRDDDAGWANERLFHLLDIFAGSAVPVDLAAIPFELNAQVAGELARRRAANPGLLHVHQHGYKHINHEPAGKKCEFGPARNYVEQRADLLKGQARLTGLLEFPLDPIFTPPWNRCTEVTARCLSDLGFGALSRDTGAIALTDLRLLELPVAIDWFGHKGIPRGEWANLLASRISGEGPIGIMLHHALMDAQEREALGQLLVVLAGHRKVRCQTMFGCMSSEAIEEAQRAS
jgi:predicted glycosyltransferase